MKESQLIQQYYYFNQFTTAKDLKQQLCGVGCGAICGVLCVSNKVEQVKK